MIIRYFWILGLIAFLSCSNQDDSIQFERNLKTDWTIQSSQSVMGSGENISQVEYNDASWYETEIPSTVLTALVRNGVYKDVYFSNNLTKIPKEQFNVAWWYRNVFEIKNIDTDEQIHLLFDGINYRANIWVNGTLVASADSIESPFRRYEFNISDFVSNGRNAVAVEVIPPEKLDLTIGFVDWNPNAPDNNMGIWREVYIKRSNSISVKNTFIQTDINDQLNQASLNISTQLINHIDKEIAIQVIGTIEDKQFSRDVVLGAKEKTTLVFNHNDYKELIFENPRLWWPNNLGDPNLYDCNIAVFHNNKKLHEENVRFGIREVEEYVNDQGHKGWKINGKNVLIRGAGWVDDVMLSDSEEKVAAQLEYVKHMNLNTVRLEGFWGNSKAIYEKADELGLLIMIGWSCHWEWEGYCGRPEIEYMSITSEEDMNLQARGYADQVLWLRNHPSIFLWVYGSDKLPHPDLERKLNDYVDVLDPSRPVLACCKYWDFGTEHYNISEVSGPTGVKMLGPYAYVTPNYWYVDKNQGGAYGFNTETGPGPQVPPLESIKKMIPEENLWPIDSIWEFHLGRNEFQTLNRYLKAFNARYGEANDVEDFAFRSQISNYEAIRAMFEAFAVNKYNATGVIQWMLNSAWPEMFWQLYDWYLMPNGAFYGTKKACQPLNLIYNYGNRSIYLSNDYNLAYKNLEVEVTMLDLNSKEIFSQELTIDVEPTSTKEVLEIPTIPNLSSTYFIDLRIKSDNQELSNNFYWLSTKEDVHDFDNRQWHLTPYLSYGDLTGLNDLPPANIDVKHAFTDSGEDQVLEVTLENTSDCIAFFIELTIKGQDSKQTILPVFWDDNYISLMPGEQRTLKAKFSKESLNGDVPVFEYEGLNISQ